MEGRENMQLTNLVFPSGHFIEKLKSITLNKRSIDINMNFKNISKYTFYLFIFIIVVISSGCKIKYSTTGASVSIDAKTAYLPSFQNRALLVQPTLAQRITDKLRDKILSQTHLKIVNTPGDVNIEGTINNYATEPMAPQAGTNITSALNRLTISVQIKFTNTKDPQFDSDSPISRYLDYSSNRNLSDIENSKEYDALLDQIVQDIFNKAFVNW
jgi:hypothetical protein